MEQKEIVDNSTQTKKTQKVVFLSIAGVAFAVILVLMILSFKKEKKN